MKYLKAYNESIRDKMTPITDETLRKRIDGRINKYRSSLGYFDYQKYGWELIFDKSMLTGRDPYYIFVDKDNNHWSLRLESFKTNNLARIQFGASIPNKFRPSSRYFYHFSELEKYLEEMGIEKTNESLRDKMTPKSTEEIWNNLDNSLDDGYKLSKTISALLNNTESVYQKFWREKDVMHEMLLTIPDYKLDLRTITSVLKEADSRLAFGIEHIYVPIWQSLPTEVKKETLKNFIEKHKIV